MARVATFGQSPLSACIALTDGGKLSAHSSRWRRRLHRLRPDPKLLDRGYSVDVVDLFWFGNNLTSNVGVVHRDIFDLQVSDLSGYDQVIFLAGLSNDPMADFSPAKNFVFNAAAPAYLAYIAKRAKVKRYIYASSCSVYGYTENELFDEDRPVSSSYPYGISKLQGERAVMQMVDSEFSVIGTPARDCIRIQSAHAVRSARQHHVQVRDEGRPDPRDKPWNLAPISQH